MAEHISCDSLTLYQTHIDNPKLKIKALVLSTTPNGGCIRIYNRWEEEVLCLDVNDDGIGNWVRRGQLSPRNVT